MPSARRAEVTRGLEELGGFCLVFRPSEYSHRMPELPAFFWAERDYFMVRITVNYRSNQSWYIKEIRPKPEDEDFSENNCTL